MQGKRILFILWTVTATIAVLVTCDGPSYQVVSSEKVETTSGVGITLKPGGVPLAPGFLGSGHATEDILIGATIDQSNPNRTIGFIKVSSPSRTDNFSIGTANNDNLAVAGFVPRFTIGGDGSIDLVTKDPNFSVNITANTIKMQSVTSNSNSDSMQVAFAVTNNENLLEIGNGFSGTAIANTLYASLASPSDIRLKTKILDLQDPLAKILQLHGVSYEWKQVDNLTARSFPDGRQIGLIAQEVQAIVPEVVQTAGDSLLSISYDKLVPLLIEAIKEQQKTLEEQEGKLKKLEEKVSFLTSDKI